MCWQPGAINNDHQDLARHSPTCRCERHLKLAALNMRIQKAADAMIEADDAGRREDAEKALSECDQLEVELQQLLAGT